MIERLIRKTILKRFFEIQLSSKEEGLANDSVAQKYKKAVIEAGTFSILLIPALLFLDTAIVISVLIPATMVAGTAWFSVSLASIKDKFGDFGMELTTDLFVGFTLSLLMLLLATAVSLTEFYWEPYIAPFSQIVWVKLSSAALATLVVGRLLFSIFSGSLKYDINDTMLTGQNEAAERFFKKSLSVLHTTSDELKRGRRLHVANYSIGVAFYEVFRSIQEFNPTEENVNAGELITKANMLINEPNMDEDEANILTIYLADSFLESCRSSAPESTKHKSFDALSFEVGCLKRTAERAGNKKEKMEELEIQYEDRISKMLPRERRAEQREIELIAQEQLGLEDQEMTDIRISVILAEITTLIEEFGHKIMIASA